MYSELSLLKDPREELTAGRVIPLEGDLSKPRLGLEDQDYDMLCKEVHVIIHNGAVVNAALPYLGNVTGIMCMRFLVIRFITVL